MEIKRKKSSHRLDLILQGKAGGIYTARELKKIKAIKPENLKEGYRLIGNQGRVLEVIKLPNKKFGVQILTLKHAINFDKSVDVIGTLGYIYRQGKIQAANNEGSFGTSFDSKIVKMFLPEKGSGYAFSKGDRIVLDILPNKRPRRFPGTKEKSLVHYRGLPFIDFKELSASTIKTVFVEVPKETTAEKLEEKKRIYKEMFPKWDFQFVTNINEAFLPQHRNRKIQND